MASCEATRGMVLAPSDEPEATGAPLNLLQDNIFIQGLWAHCRKMNLGAAGLPYL